MITKTAKIFSSALRNLDYLNYADTPESARQLFLDSYKDKAEEGPTSWAKALIGGAVPGAALGAISPPYKGKGALVGAGAGAALGAILKGTDRLKREHAKSIYEKSLSDPKYLTKRILETRRKNALDAASTGAVIGTNAGRGY